MARDVSADARYVPDGLNARHVTFGNAGQPMIAGARWGVDTAQIKRSGTTVTEMVSMIRSMPYTHIWMLWM